MHISPLKVEIPDHLCLSLHNLDLTSLQHSMAEDRKTDQTSTLSLKADDGLFCRLEEENARLPPQDSTAFILAQIERQNALLEKDPKSITIQSNKLKAHLTTHQKLIRDTFYSPSFSTEIKEHDDIDWGFWEAVIKDFEQVALKLPHLLSVRLRYGIPSCIRGLIWQAMCKSASLHLETVYEQLCHEKSPHERMIQRDLSRTFPRIEMFKKENGEGQLSMRRVLEAYSLYDTEVGYCQGLAFLVGPLLMNMPETQSFCVFVRLMETYEMRSMFTLNMEGLQLRLFQFSNLLSEILPDLSAYFDTQGVHAAMYASQWFLTLFAYAFPIQLVIQIYDIIIAEGAAETIMRVAIAMLKRSQNIILTEKSEFEDILDYVTSSKLCFPYNGNYGSVIQDTVALSDIITKKKIDALQHKYETADIKSKRTELTGRFGFWKKRGSFSQKIMKKRPDIKRSSSIGEPNSPPLIKRWSSVSSGDWPSLASATTDDTSRSSFSSLPSFHSSVIRNTSASSLPPTIESTSSNDTIRNHPIESLVKELQQLKKKYQQTLDELTEVRYDKEDLASERDALKLTILELERRYYSKKKESLSEDDGKSLFEKIQQDENNRKDSCQFIHPTSSSSSYLGEEESILTVTSSVPSTDTQTEDIHSEVVHIKVKNFELQQHCEKLTFDLDLVRSQFDMVNEGQMALVDRLIHMKTDMDDLVKEKKSKDLQWLEINHENQLLRSQLKEMRHTLNERNDTNQTLLNEIQILKGTKVDAIMGDPKIIATLEITENEDDRLIPDYSLIQPRHTYSEDHGTMTKQERKISTWEELNTWDELQINNREDLKVNRDLRINTKGEPRPSLYGRVLSAISPKYSSVSGRGYSG
ncbi:rab-GTPase-TBC domain-containing protein [Pilobolus umbonatus]|nr:rab-GTPase-TBC domain-containing protein [Pilobolus umbonatus]